MHQLTFHSSFSTLALYLQLFNGSNTSVETQKYGVVIAIIHLSDTANILYT